MKDIDVKREFLLAIMLLLITTTNVLCQQSTKQPFDTDQKLDKPVLFADGIISTEDDEFGGTFASDGRIYFSKSVPGSYLYVICFSEYRNGKWTEPEVAPFSGSYRDFDPVASPDGNTLLFASDRPIDSDNKNNYNIWTVKRSGKGWSEPAPLPAQINSEHDEHFASMAANGNIYFSSTRADAAGGSDVYVSKFVNGSYTIAERLDSVSTDAFELDVIISPDEKFLLVCAIGRQDGYGGFDIFISNRDGDSWPAATNLGTLVNTPFRDYSPRIAPGGKYLFFTSEKDFTSQGPSPSNYNDMMKKFHSTLNGLGNIYQVESNIAIK